MKKWLISLAVSLFLIVGSGHNALAILINFDDASDGTVVNSRYTALGVTFSNPLGGDIFARNGSGFAPSSPNVVSVFGTGLPPFDALFGAVDATFSTSQLIVSIDARPVGPVEFLGTLQNRPFLEAFDGATFLGRVLYAGSLPTGCCFEVGPTETLTFTSTTANITRVRFSSQTSQSTIHTFGLFDNLNFDTARPVPEPATLLLLGSGLAGLGLWGWRRKRMQGDH